MIGSHKTTVRLNVPKAVLSVVYHSTEVVKVMDNKYAVLDSGGWLTPTTKRRMNQASSEFRLNFQVFQRGYIWYVKTPYDEQEFYDNIMIDISEGVIVRK